MWSLWSKRIARKLWTRHLGDWVRRIENLKQAQTSSGESWKDRNASFPLFFETLTSQNPRQLVAGAWNRGDRGKRANVEPAMFASQDESWESVLYSTVHVFSTIELCAEKSLELHILGVNMYLHRTGMRLMPVTSQCYTRQSFFSLIWYKHADLTPILIFPLFVCSKISLITFF